MGTWLLPIGKERDRSAEDSRNLLNKSCSRSNRGDLLSRRDCGSDLDMSFDDAVIFNDSQQYTDLYRIKSGKQLLAPLNEQKAYIFITKQIVNEVNKHKLPEARKFFSEKCQIGAAPNCALPDHLFDDSGATVARIREKLKSAGDNVNEANKELQAAVAKTLLAISRSEDVVSKALQPLFATAVPHQPDELERARLRKDMGIPPG